MPGSLGLEAMHQALELWCVHAGLGGGKRDATFSHELGKTAWKYRGQLTPKNKVLECEVHLKKVEKGAGKATVIADGYLVVDSLRVYEVIDMRLDIVSGFEPPRQSPAAGGLKARAAAWMNAGGTAGIKAADDRPGVRGGGG